jgi:beta-xylosidase
MDIMKKKTGGNPIIAHKYTCDPTALVVGEELYLYTGHDEAPVGKEEYIMNDWLCFSSKNLIEWKEHPVPLKATDFSWASGDAYASKVIERNGLYYWYVSVSHSHKEGKAIAVAVSDHPAGPFRDAIGKALITHDMLPGAESEKANLDPCVLIDDDDTAYIFWGNGLCYFARLGDSLLELDGDIQIINVPEFEEGSHIHKRNGWYYLSYGYGVPEKVGYAMSRNINGPWEFKGILNDIVENCETNRPCIIDFKGASYFIYHNGALHDGSSHRRSVCIDYLHYNNDGTIQKVIMTSKGVQPAQ